MKFGFRGYSPKRALAAKFSWKRQVRHGLGIKMPRGWGFLTNPKKALYNRVYNRTTFGIRQIAGSRKMPKKEQSSGTGCGCILLVVGVLGMIGLFQQGNFSWGAIAVAAVLICIGLVALSGGKSTKDQCELCGNPTRGTIYTWTLKGKETQVCSKCNQHLERRQSKQAVDQLVDGEG